MRAQSFCGLHLLLDHRTQVLRGHERASDPISSFVPSALSLRKWMHTNPHESLLCYEKNAELLC